MNLLFLNKTVFFIVFLLVFAGDILSGAPAFSEEITIKERLGEFVPLDLSFSDEHGNPVTLKQLIHRPTILSLGYYSCTELCSPLLNGIVDLLKYLPAEAGVDYTVLTVSIDETETPLLALQKKQNFLKQLPDTFQSENWRFLTGDKENIQAITDAAAFYLDAVCHSMDSDNGHAYYRNNSAAFNCGEIVRNWGL